MINNFANSYHVLPGIGWGVGIVSIGALIFILVMFAVLALKGYALWVAARRDDKGWFVALLILNTIGILELIYLYAVADVWGKKDKKHDDKEEKKEHTHPHEHKTHKHEDDSKNSKVL